MVERENLVLFAVGDVGPNRKEPDSIFQHVAPLLRTGDLGFCQLEPALSARGTPLPQARLPMRAKPEGAQAIRRAGFHVVSFASNHCMDWGREAFFDTLETLKEQQLSVLGVGTNLETARRPVIFECRGTRIGFLGYNTILPQGYWADVDRPGCVPLRAHTVYEQVEHDQPGTPCRIHTFPHRADLEAMRADIQAAKARADLVIVSVHWGIHFVRAVLADYQRDIAHAAIDAGADLILGHHAHVLKGIETYRGKVIFYSLGNFALEAPSTFATGSTERHARKELLELYSVGKPNPTSLMQADSLMTVIVRCIIVDKQITRVVVIPAYINASSEPEILGPGTPRAHQVISYLEEISKEQGLTPRLSASGDGFAIG